MGGERSSEVRGLGDWEALKGSRSEASLPTPPYPRMREGRGGKQLSSNRPQRLITQAPYSSGGSVSSRVYVGNLSFWTSWQDLKDHMKSAGVVVRAELLEGKDGRSKGCAVVQFGSAKDARRAIEVLNDSMLGGRKIFVREDRVGTPAGAVDPSRRVYIGNLPWSVDWRQLKDLLRQCGEVMYVDVAVEGNRSKGYATAEFATSEAAAECIRQFNDFEVEGRTLNVREDREPRSLTSEGLSVSSDAGLRRLYIGNIPLSVSWQDLKDHLRKHCEVLHVDIPIEGDRSRGYAIAEFPSTAEAVACIRHFHGTEFRGSSLNIREDRETPTKTLPTQDRSFGDNRVVKAISSSAPSSCRVFVSNLSYDVAWQDLKDHFRSCGEVVRADVAVEDGSRRSRGFGFIEYSTTSEAMQAIQVLNNSVLLGREIHVREDRDPIAA